MSQKIAVVPLSKGLRNDVLPFNLDNDSFPVLRNAYQWRSRVRRKRGTTLLGRLKRYIGTTDGSGNASITLSPLPILSGASQFVVGAVTFTDPGGASPVNLISTGVGTATLNRTSGALVITGTGALANTPIEYYPGTPVLGLENLELTPGSSPGLLAFDQGKCYNVNTNYPNTIYDVSYYKNPSTGSYAGYVQKTTWTPTYWNGKDYQQYWSKNFSNAFWVTNGVEVPFSISNIGMQYKAITGVTIDAAGPPALATLTINSHGLVKGDFVFINEVGGITGINMQTGYVVSADPQAANTVQVEFPAATLGGAYSTGGIAQYLTSNSDITKSCLRYYDGAPVSSATTPVFQTNSGWVNFAPPLVSESTNTYTIADLPPGQYYLIGARMILPFKDRLLFLGPVVQTSAAGSQRYLQDTVIYSQNGTPYYTCSFPYTTAYPSPSIIPTTAFTPILVPTNQTAQPSAFWEDVVGYGGFISSGFQDPIITATSNEDVLIIGFSNVKARFAYTGNDIVPFNFYIINSEFGSQSTFSAINFDRGMIDFGARGITITSQVSSDRIDLEIPDEVFKTNLRDNGRERITAQRDYINEWIYFSYPAANNYSTTDSSSFPSQTLFYNYRDKSWAIFRESYTCYGQFHRSSGQNWDDLTEFTWDEWNDLWDSGEQTIEQPEVIGGNQQGFILFLAEGTGEDTSLYISNISSSVVTSPNHTLDENDYITISGVQGTIGAQVNGKIFSVASPSFDGNSFSLNPPLTSGTYLGGGKITRMYVPFIQTKQFPVAWNMSKKTRIGAQQYLLSATDSAQITLLIYLSENTITAFNNGPIVPSPKTLNNSLIYSTILYTCPESTNLGLTPANVNLQQLNEIGFGGTSVNNQAQIWHRVNTSLIGDTIQLAFTLSDDQMRDTSFTNQFDEIELHSFIIDVSPSGVLA